MSIAVDYYNIFAYHIEIVFQINTRRYIHHIFEVVHEDDNCVVRDVRVLSTAGLLSFNNCNRKSSQAQNSYSPAAVYKYTYTRSRFPLAYH